MSRFHSPFAPHEVIKMVPKKDGKGWKEPTMPDAIELLLVPGVTTTLDVEKGSLTEYRVNQAIFHCAVLPFTGRFDGSNEAGHPDHKINPDDYKEYEREIQGRMKDVLEGFADDGSDVDRELKNYFDGKPYKLQDKIMPCVEAVTARMKELGVVKLVSGLRLFSPTLWVTGEPDMFGFNADGKLVWVFDLKRKNKSTFEKAKSEKGLDENHRLQLGHYLLMLEERHDALNPRLDILMSCRDDERAKIVPINDTEQWKQAALHHNKSWMLRKGWGNPAERFEREKEAIKARMDEIVEHNRWLISQ